MNKEVLKQAIERAEYNCTGECIEYTINEIVDLSEEGAYLVFASSSDRETSFVAYEDGTCYFLTDWEDAYPHNEDEIADFEWVTEDWKNSPTIFNGLPRVLFTL